VAQAKKRAKPPRRLTQDTLIEVCVDVWSEATSSNEIRDIWGPFVRDNHPLYVEGVFVVVESCAAVFLEEGLQGLAGGVLRMER
jgi:hypothetical protein